MAPPDRSADIRAIERLNADFRYFLDAGDADAFAALFTEDALYANGPRESRGRAAIADFMAGRQAMGKRVSRHIYSGLRIDFAGDNQATANSVWMSFAQNGEPPFQMAEPFLVADMDDVYVREGGAWRIQERRITPLFMNPRVPPPGG